MEVFLPIAQVLINPIEILLLSAIVGILSGLIGGGYFLFLAIKDGVINAWKNK